MYVCTFKEQLEVRGESLQEGANPLIGRTATTSSSCLSQTHADCKHLTPGLAVPSNARGKRLPWTRLHPCATLQLHVPWGKLLCPQDPGPFGI